MDRGPHADANPKLRRSRGIRGVGRGRVAPCGGTRSGAPRRRPRTRRGCASVGAAFEADGFARVDDIADADFVLNMFDAEQPKAFRRQSRGTYSASFYELPEVPDDVLKTSYPMLVRTLANVVVLHVPGDGRVVHDDGARHVQDLRRPGRGVRAPRAAREVEARDRQRVRPRSRAGALGRRRGHRGHRRRRQAHAGARPAARPVPRARVPRRARPTSRDAALPGRRPLLREPLARARTRRASG